MDYAKNRQESDRVLNRIYHLLEEGELADELKRTINSIRDNKYTEDY